MATGIDKVIAVLTRLGCAKEIPPYPSLFLGALDLSPLEVTQIYQTLAAEGFHTPLRAIRGVLDAEHRPLQQFPLAVEQRVEPEYAFLINTALQRVVQEGTASSLAAVIPPSLGLAGKTGTSDDGRDSWFAGFSGDRLAVVWLGRDDNSPANLTGAGGALVVWGKMMRELHPQPLTLIEPAGIQWRRVNAGPNRQGGTGQSAVNLPFIAQTAPDRPEDETEAAHAAPQDKVKNAIRRFLDRLF